jgi:hypothetical protein
LKFLDCRLMVVEENCVPADLSCEQEKIVLGVRLFSV